jgi:hypothetical protein
MEADKMVRAQIAHRSPGRIRLRLMSSLDNAQTDALIKDLKVSPEVSKVTVRGSHLIIEHEQDDVTTALGKTLSRLFPGFERASDQFDSQVAKTVADPWIMNLIPAGFLGLAVYTGLRNGAVLAGESAFALGYVAFDLYWKFQQENIMRKMEKGLSAKNRSELESYLK